MSTKSSDSPPNDPSRRKERTSQPAVIIREMELEDLSPVFALGEALFTADLWPNLYRTWDEYELVQTFASDGETCVVAELDGKVVGFALGTLIDKRRSAWTYGYLVWLGVDPGVARRGVGKKLTNRLTEIFISLGARIMIVDTEADNEPAVQFFRRQGFGNETRHVYLTKNLTSHPEYIRRKTRLHPPSKRQDDPKIDPVVQPPMVDPAHAPSLGDENKES